MLRALGVSRSFGGQTVLDEVSVSIDGRDRVGVVGPNGVGKSTLLRLLGGSELPDGGRIERAPASLTVGFLPQEPDARPGETLLGYLARRTGVAEASDELDRRTEDLSAEPESVDAYSAALDRFLALGGDDLESRAAEVLATVGLQVGDGGRFVQEVATLSGGEAARAALAAILLSRVDVLLLDEPTNNLDFAGIDLLESFVDGFGGAVLVVSHDRAFLDRCVSRIVELDEHSHRGRRSSPAGGATTSPVATWPGRSSPRPTAGTSPSGIASSSANAPRPSGARRASGRPRPRASRTRTCATPRSPAARSRRRR